MLAKIRTICLWVYLAVFTPIASILAILVSPFDRLGLTKHANHFTNYPTLYWSRGLLWAANTSLELTGKLPEKDSPYIIVSNHRSHLDGPVLLWLLRPVSFRFLVKWELFYVPIMGLAFWAIGMVFVKRGNQESARRSLAKVIERIRGGENIVVFPEGTRSRHEDGSRLLPFKAGAFVTAQKGGVPILPVGIAGSAEIYGHGWFAREWHGHIVAKVGDPIDTTGYTAAQIDELSGRVREEILKLRAEAHEIWLKRAEEKGIPVRAAPRGSMATGEHVPANP